MLGMVSLGIWFHSARSIVRVRAWACQGVVPSCMGMLPLALDLGVRVLCFFFFFFFLRMQAETNW